VKSTVRQLAVTLFSLALAGCNCGDDGRTTDAGVDAGVCVPSAVSMAVTTPNSFACHAKYTATFRVTNGGCAPLTVSALHITQTRTDGGCAPGPFSSQYLPTTASVSAGQTVTVLDLMGAPFCCAGSGCPADYSCQYRFDFTADTSAGMLTTSSAVGDLQLGGCTELCP
jgi:hypothetical protein